MKYKSLRLFGFFLAIVSGFLTFSSFQTSQQDITLTAQIECWLGDAEKLDRYTVTILQEKDTFSITEVYTGNHTFLLPIKKGIYSIIVKAPGHHVPVKKTIDSDAINVTTIFEYKYYITKFIYEYLDTPSNILFETNSHKLSLRQKMKLDLFYKNFINRPGFENRTLFIVSHQDIEEKEGVSLKRARTVKKYLEKKGLDPDRLTIENYKATSLRYTPEYLVTLKSDDEIIKLKGFNRCVNFMISD